MNFSKHSIIPCWVHLLTLLGLCFFLPLAQAQNAKKKKKPAVPEGVKVVRDIEFAKPNGYSLKLDLYLPREKSADPLPVVMWVHGGGWKNGSKKNCKSAYLAARGFAAVSIDYRLLDVAQWPSQIDDCYEAVRWIRQNAGKYHLDGDHIGVWGGSAGGHLVALMGTRLYSGEESVSSKVQAVCDWYGPSELLTMPPNNVGPNRTLEQVSQSNGARLLGATVMDVPKLAKDASALDNVSSDDASFLIMHGNEDPGVPIDQSRKLHAALIKAGVSSELIVVKGAAHGGPLFNTADVYNTVEAFFAKQLKN